MKSVIWPFLEEKLFSFSLAEYYISFVYVTDIVIVISECRIRIYALARVSKLVCALVSVNIFMCVCVSVCFFMYLSVYVFLQMCICACIHVSSADAKTFQPTGKSPI